MKFIMVYIELGIVIGIIMVLVEISRIRPRFYINPRKALGMEKKAIRVQDEKFKALWDDVMRKSEAAPPQSLSLAIIEADSFIDTILKENLKLSGEHMANRLERLDDDDLQSLDGLWKAHRIRNDLVHTPGYYLNPSDARRVLSYYEAFLKEIEVI
jgi:hypothetical protein